MVAGTTDKVINTNLLKNPSFKTTSGVYELWKNLAHNPSMVATGASAEVRTNLFSNPTFEGTFGSITIRTNLATNPRMTNIDMGGYGSQTLSAVSTIPAHPEGITSAVRVGYGVGSSNAGVVIMHVPDSSSQYSVSAWVYNEGTTSEAIAIALRGVTSGGSQGVLPGVWTHLTWTMTTGTTGIGQDYGIRIASPAAAGSFLVTGVLIEKSSTVRSYFDGSTGAAGDFTHAWTGAADASSSVQKGVGLATVAQSGTCYVIQSSEWASTGSKSLRLITAPNSTYPEVNLITSLATLVPGKTYTASGKMRITEAATLSFPRARRFNFYSSDNNGVTWTEVNGVQAPNTPGIHSVSMTFTVPPTANSIILRVGANNVNTYAFQSDVWWDDILVEEGFVTRPYFDASNPEYKNLFTNPSVEVNTAGWNSRWFGSTGGVGVTARSAGTGIDGGYSIRKTWTSANTGSSLDVGFEVSAPVMGGKTYTFSGYQRASVTTTCALFIQWINGSGVQIGPSTTRSTISSPSGVYVRNSSTVTAPAGAVTARMIIGPYDGASPMAVGDWIEVDAVLAEEGSILNTYYEGTGDFSYVWSGTANASSSVQQAATVANTVANKSGSNLNAKFILYQSRDENSKPISRWVAPAGSPSSSWRVAGISSGGFDWTALKTGKVYSLYYKYRASGWPAGSTTTAQLATGASTNHVITNDVSRSLNTTGWQTYRRTFTALRDADAGTMLYITLPNVPSETVDGIFELSEWYIVETEYTGPFFDGATPQKDGLSNNWTGLTNASTSSQKAVGVGDTYAAVSQVHNYQMSENGQTFWRSYIRNPLAFGLNTISANDRPAGTYTMLCRIRTSVGTRQIRPRISGDQADSITLTTEWQDFRIVKATSGNVGYTGLVNTNPAAGWVSGDLVDIAYMAIVPGVYNGPFFDGNTDDTGDFVYGWDGQVDYSVSTQRAMNVSGSFNQQRAEVYASTVAPFSGSASAKGVVNAIGYFPRYEQWVTPVPGRRYTAMAKMKASAGPVQIGIKWVTNPDIHGAAVQQAASNGNWATVKTSSIAPDNATFMYVWMGVPDSTALGTEFEIDQLMIVGKDYNGPFGTGSSYGWEWDGVSNASTSVGFPVGMMQLAGKPLFLGTTAGSYVLTDIDPAKNPVIAAEAPRIIYTVVNNLLDIPTSGIQNVYTYGIDNLLDTVPNKTIIFRQESMAGTGVNHVKARRTGGGGPIAFGVPSSGKQILISGMDENGKTFAALNNSPLAVDDFVTSSIPHERILIAGNTPYHQHIVTYIYPGVHSPAVRQEMVKLLAHEYAIPGM